MKTFITELIPQNSRKSFYGKAKVIELNGAHYLWSYDTTVACVDKKMKPHRFSDRNSKTTREHVKSFLEMFENMIPSKDFWKLPCETEPELKIVI